MVNTMMQLHSFLHLQLVIALMVPGHIATVLILLSIQKYSPNT